MISTDGEKASDKIQCLFLILKSLSKSGTEGNFLNSIKNSFKTPTASIILGEKPEAFSPGSETRQGWCLLSPLFFNIILEVLAGAVRQRKMEDNTNREGTNT